MELESLRKPPTDLLPILGNPSDPGPRLVLADWLEDRGERLQQSFGWLGFFGWG